MGPDIGHRNWTQTLDPETGPRHWTQKLMVSDVIGQALGSQTAFTLGPPELKLNTA